MNRRHVYSALCIHWDHHPADLTQHYGAGTNTDQIRHYLSTVSPDVTQYHAIGCLGYASYPSALAPVVPGLVGDPLQVWAQACDDMGVPFACYAASFDCRSPQPVPQWRCVSRSGVVSERDYCPSSPWAEDFFIPVLLEIVVRYHPAHFWLDGAWLPSDRANYCFCEHCQRRFQRNYGRPMPSVPSGVDWLDLQEFHEQSLDDAIGRIGRAVKRRDPGILLACNRAYFFGDARKPIPEVDWLSWDALNTPNLHRASFEATYPNTAGLPADIMIYDHAIVRWEPELLRRPRTLAQLKTEAGILLAHGARVSLWHDPNPDGSIPDSKAELAGQVAQFVRERQDWCIDNRSAAEVAVLVSRLDHCLSPGHQDTAVRAAHQLLQEAHIPCDIVRDDSLLSRLVQYQLVVLPETIALNLDTAQWLRQYILDGGCVLLIVSTAAGGSAQWQETLLGKDIGLLPCTQSSGVVKWNGQQVQLGHPRCRAVGNWRPLVTYEDGETPWLAELTVGDGSILAIMGEAATEYAQTHWPALRNLVAAAALKGIGQLPLVEMQHHPGIEVVLNRRGGDLYVHLVNLTPGGSFGASGELFFDEVPIYRDLALTVRPPRQPSSITLCPGGKDLGGLAEVNECQDPEGHCTLRIVVPELCHHCAVRLANAMDVRLNQEH